MLFFGLYNGSASFQRYINDIIIKYLDDFYTVYINNIFIYSEDPLEHEFYIKKILEYLKTAGLQTDIKKSEFR